MSAESRKVVIASRNADKVRELGEIMAGLPFAVVPADDYPGLPEVIEDGTTCTGNATRKALVTAAFTGEIAVADDTSLQVRELNGLPDVFAARFSGPEATYASNAALLLELMQGVPEGSRQARFVTACVWIDPRPRGKPRQVQAPGVSRWLHNPWAGNRAASDPATAAVHWRELLDRDEVWERYRTDLLANMVSWGHDPERAREVALDLLAAADRDRHDAVPAGAVRLPDPRIWVTSDRRGAAAPTRLVPAGLPDDAPGRATNAAHFFQLTATGKLLGTITGEPVGAGGFGYDPVFRPTGEARTLAELEPAAKNAVSHRGRALRRLLAAVTAAYGPA